MAKRKTHPTTEELLRLSIGLSDALNNLFPMPAVFCPYKVGDLLVRSYNCGELVVVVEQISTDAAWFTVVGCRSRYSEPIHSLRATTRKVNPLFYGFGNTIIDWLTAYHTEGLKQCRSHKRKR
jgi:hypothetical protein